GAGRVVVVVGPGMAAVVDAARAGLGTAAVVGVEQAARKGTGHAVRMAKDALSGCAGPVVVVFGDTPLISSATLQKLAAGVAAGQAVMVAGMRPSEPGAYGRLVLAADGTLERIVEAKDATAEERAIGLCNAGAMALDGQRMWDLLAQIRPDNAKGEYYLTDVVGLARAQGLRCGVIEAAAEEAVGVNSRLELAEVEALFQARMRREAMLGGATLVDPASVWFSHDTVLGRDVVVGPCVVFGPGVVVGDNVAIKGFCHLEGTTIDAGAQVGPFARLRPGASIGADAHVGNFVEIKAALIGAGAKVNHLSYVGDAEVGSRANVGAGTITCNYDGFVKARTKIGAGAFIGSNTALVAPVSVGDGAIVAAGSVITADVAADALAVARGRQEEKPGWAARFRAIKASAKLKSKRG
ncbi:MAG TPA: bifunctional UDP-N-acetylglucosamine diphosphorylase/glucosamine-1-phosphate N-acetyltransferase GlmU, partial [Reyranellaceae bacterium]|nr:bifunctional UDP-N-acetylglucosamine diphosphorylase/glucosamine-1-phosphate N-acetyltransferase GlmU [Reyranellaceae bacterium]